MILAAHGSICYPVRRWLKTNLVLWEPSAMGRLLVSVRGPDEAVAAAKGGAHIADLEYPGSALGTPYPLNIKAVRQRLDAEGFAKIPISTNIGEDQPVRSTACQAALGVAVAGADYVKCGFAGLDPKAASYVGRNLVRTVKEWCPGRKVYPAFSPRGGVCALLRSFSALLSCICAANRRETDPSASVARPSKRSSHGS